MNAGASVPQRTVYLDGKDTPLQPMEVSIGSNKESFTRLMRTVVKLRCKITDTHMATLGDIDTARPHDTVILLIWIPETHLKQFEERVKPQDMREPAKIHLD